MCPCPHTLACAILKGRLHPSRFLFPAGASPFLHRARGVRLKANDCVIHDTVCNRNAALRVFVCRDLIPNVPEASGLIAVICPVLGVSGPLGHQIQNAFEALDRIEFPLPDIFDAYERFAFTGEKLHGRSASIRQHTSSHSASP